MCVQWYNYSSFSRALYELAHESQLVSLGGGSMHKPELLAPAGSFESLRAAAWAGADAVYLGGKSFNARAGATNFDDDELHKGILFAHRAGVKVYVTVNTLLKQEELEGALRFLTDLYNMGADAVIIQDMGLMKLAAQCVPGLERHASTQTTTASRSGVAAWRELGANRVVLARELSSAEVLDITQAQILPVEIFVHGALCVAYSGQCLLSSIIGGRSGNRGQCAQPCRLPYSGASRYPLSPRDLCLIDHVPELLDLGCASWKIEGRLKRPEYVAEVVSVFRRAIDRASQGGRYSVSSEDKTRLLQAFNRGFTTGYLHGKPQGELYSGVRPDNRGIVVGEVLSVTRTAIRVRLHRGLAEGDVLDFGNAESSFVVSNGASAGTEVEFNQAPSISLDRGALVHRLVDAERTKQLTANINEYEPAPLEVNFVASGDIGQPLHLQACAQDNCVEVCGESCLEPARSLCDTQTLVERQLKKLGGTPFVAKHIVVDLESNVFISAAEINTCRRRAIELLTEKLWGRATRVSAPQIDPPVVRLPKAVIAQKLGVSVANAKEAAAAKAAGADYLIFGKEWLETSEEDHYRQYCVVANHIGPTVMLRLPRIMHTQEENLWKAVNPQNIPIMASSPGGIVLAREFSDSLYGDTGLNVMNTYSATVYKDLCSIALSHELNRREMRELAAHCVQELEVVVHGRQLLMVHANCTWSPECGGQGPCRKDRVFVDRKNMSFPVATDENCRSYLLNSQTLSLLDVIPTLKSAGIGRIRLELAGYGAEVVSHTVALYKQALKDPLNRDDLTYLRNSLTPHWGILTRGHWQRGV